MQDIAFFNDEVECNMMSSMKKNAECPMHAVKSMNCCEDQDLTVEASSHESIFLSGLQMQMEWVAVVAPAPLVLKSPYINQEFNSFIPYRPPPPDRNIIVLVQSFLL